MDVDHLHLEKDLTVVLDSWFLAADVQGVVLRRDFIYIQFP